MASATHTKPARAGALLVADPELLADLVRQVVGSFGTQLEAERELGRSRKQLGRYMKGEFGSRITRDTVGRLLKWTPKKRLPDLRRAFVDARTEAYLLQYRAWLEEQLGRYNLGVFPMDFEPLLGQVLSKDNGGTWEGAFRETGYRSLLRKLSSRVPYRSTLASFEEECAKLGWNPLMARYQVALRRALEPLAIDWEPGYLERWVDELERGKKSDDLNRYLSAALKKELILLKRRPALQRAQYIAANFTDDQLPLPEPKRQRRQRKGKSK
jgi:hypothetical protein